MEVPVLSLLSGSSYWGLVPPVYPAQVREGPPLCGDLHKQAMLLWAYKGIRKAQKMELDAFF